MAKRFGPALLLFGVLFCSARLTADEPSPADKPATEPAATESAAAEEQDGAQPVAAAEAAAEKPSDASTEKPAAQAAAGQKYDLKYKFTPLETVRTEVVHRATVQTTIEGTSQTAETQSKSIKLWQIKAVAADGSATFSHLVEHIDMWQRTSGRQEVRYNSDTDKTVPPGYEEVAKAVGVPLSTVTMNSRGKILRRKEHRDQPMGTSTQMTMPLPDHPIGLGESWSSPNQIDVSLKDGSLKKIETRQKFTLEEVSGNVATIKVDCQVLTPISDPAIEAQLIQRMSEGHVQFDIAAGRVLSQQLDLDRRVIGFSGATSSMHYVTRFTEKLLPAEATARRSAPKAAPKTATKPAGKQQGTKTK